DRGPYGRHLASHGFQGRETEGFHLAGYQYEIGDREFFAHAINLAQKLNFLAQAFVAHQPFRARTVRPVAHQQQPRGNLLLHAVENLDDVANAFHRAEIGYVNQDALVASGKFPAALGGVGVALVGIAIDEVVDHLDRITNLEFLHGTFLQVIRDGGNAVALLDGITRHRQIRTVRADDGDVGPVQRGYEWKLASLILCS